MSGVGPKSAASRDASDGARGVAAARAASLALFERAARVIPGGIYGSKAPGFLVPGAYPYYIERAKGSRMWDADGNEYIDYLCGFGSQIVGYANERVDEAACSRIRSGDLLDQPAPIMVELAERMVRLVEGSGWAVFVKNGTDATTLALSLARVKTGKRLILAAEGAYHGAANWCGANPFPALAFERERVLTFPYGDEAALAKLFSAHRGEIAGLVLTPYHHPTYLPQIVPASSWHETARRLCDAEGALFVMDDIRANFRLHPRGSHVRFGAKPDLWCMGKALANGQPISLLMGTAPLMKAASALFITGTYWMSAAPMAAAMATLDEMERLGGVPRLEKLGASLKEGLEAAGKEQGFGARISGPPAIPFLTFDEDPDLYLNQRFGAAMARRGVFLHPHHNWFISLAHTDEDIALTVARARESFAAMREGSE
jgi:glutamate-1-semialdehyde 2,1-aminomutase